MNSSYPIEIKVISTEGLRYNRRQLAKMNLFVIIRTDSTNADQTTYMDSGEKLIVDIPNNLNFLTVELHYKGRFGNKLIGVARILAMDFVGGYIPVNHLRLLSYRLRDRKGDRVGTINLSARMKVAVQRPENGSYGWRPPSNGKVVVEDGVVNGGVVTGIPVCYGYQVV